MKKEIDEHRSKHKKVHQLGEQLIRDPKANDASYVTAVLTNVDLNWRTLEEIWAKRSVVQSGTDFVTKFKITVTFMLFS